MSSNFPFLIVSTQTVKSALNNSLVFGVGQIKSQTTYLPSCLYFSARSAIRLACLVLASSEKSQSLAALLTSSLLSHFAFSNGTNSDAKVVLPAPGKPMISIFFINYYVVASLGRGFSSIGK